MNLFDYSKYQDYIYNLNQDNLQNNISATILDCNKLQSDLLSRYVFSNID